MDWGLLFLLLPIAAVSGWLIGRRGNNRNSIDDCSNLNADYFKGLNFLLNEQSDKAIEVFVRMLEVDSDTVEIHFALGNLFLSRGEVDRAIRIHQNLIARPTLTSFQRQQALFELGKDYLRAGLLDRAESLFKQVAASQDFGLMALHHLLEVYQLEKEWLNAYEVAKRLERFDSDNEIAPMRAHFLCEQSEILLRSGNYAEATRLVTQALKEDKRSVRATILKSRLQALQGDYRAAIDTLRHVEQQSPDLISEIVPSLIDYYHHLDANDELINALEGLRLRHTTNPVIAIALAKQLAEREDKEVAIEFLLRHIQNTPTLRGVSELIEYKRSSNAGLTPTEVEHLLGLLRSLQAERPAYQCTHCGFTTRSLHWQCPSCKKWNSIRPIQGTQTE